MTTIERTAYGCNLRQRGRKSSPGRGVWGVVASVLAPAGGGRCTVLLLRGQDHFSASLYSRCCLRWWVTTQQGTCTCQQRYLPESIVYTSGWMDSLGTQGRYHSIPHTTLQGRRLRVSRALLACAWFLGRGKSRGPSSSGTCTTATSTPTTRGERHKRWDGMGWEEKKTPWDDEMDKAAFVSNS